MIQNRFDEKVWIKNALLFLAVLFSFLFVFKNYIFYSYSELNTFSVKDLDYDKYSVSYYTKNIDPVNSNANEIELFFPEGLPNDTIVQVYQVTNTGEEIFLEQREVRKGYKNVKIHSGIYFNRIKVSYFDYTSRMPIVITNQEITLLNRKLNLLQKNLLFILKIFAAAAAAGAITFLMLRISVGGNSRSNRSSNIELLRVLCMLMLVAHHFVVHGGVSGQQEYWPKHIAYFFVPIGKICFIAFIAISMYFLVDGKAKFERFFRCWLEVLVYSVTLTLMTWLFGGCVRFRDFASSFFVISGNSHGFASSYLLFLLLYPFILKSVKNISKAQARYLLLVLFIAQILSQMMKVWTGYDQKIYSEILLFVLCFVLSLNLKRWPFGFLKDEKFLALAFLLLYCSIFAWNYKCSIGESGFWDSIFLSVNADESGVFYIIAGYLLFYVFLNLEVKNSRLINSVSMCTFGVLLIHDHNFFRHIFWNELVRTEILYYSKFFVGYFVVFVGFIFLSSAIIDYIRIHLLEKKMLSIESVRRAIHFVDGVFDEK